MPFHAFHAFHAGEADQLPGCPGRPVREAGSFWPASCGKWSKSPGQAAGRTGALSVISAETLLSGESGELAVPAPLPDGAFRDLRSQHGGSRPQAKMAYHVKKPSTDDFGTDSRSVATRRRMVLPAAPDGLPRPSAPPNRPNWRRAQPQGAQGSHLAPRPQRLGRVPGMGRVAPALPHSFLILSFHP